MKYLQLILLLFTTSLMADQRFETWQGLCHFAYDPADDDNNETVYTTNDWNLDIHWKQDNQVLYKLDCRGGAQQ